VIPGGSSVAYRTGDWRQDRPVLDLERCIHCLFCWLYCPDSAVLVRDGRVLGIDYEHCKGCGICAAVCPPKAKAIHMVPEGEP
jgi:2-oxoacid:acceptor oxidoreductase delta subunit (pyruvate/2-ketoisovalerate family)